ncbi:MAG: hypothetical protein J2P32_08365, partial [Actinobacteria bacterium]|nr:hypothetical protein [Actinomycetota bacterium]
ERASKRTDTGPALAAGYESLLSDCSGGQGCTDGDHELAGRQPPAQAARGPPADGRDLNHETRHGTTDGTEDDEPGSASQLMAGALQTKLDRVQLNKIFDQARTFAQNLIGDVSQLDGTAGGSGSNGPSDKISQRTEDFLSGLFELLGVDQHRGQPGRNSGAGSGTGSQNNLAGSIMRLVDNFVSSLLNLLGVGQPGGQSGNSGGDANNGTGSGSGSQDNPANSITQLTDNFVSTLLDLLGIGQPSGSDGNGGSSGSSGSSGQANPADSISRLTHDFVSGLLRLVGRGSGSESAGSQDGGDSQGSRRPVSGVSGLGDSVSKLTNDFVSGLLGLVDRTRPGSGSPGGGVGPGDRGDQHGIAGLVGSILDSVSDLTGGILGSLPGMITNALSGHHQSGHRPQPDPEQGDLAASVSKLTNSFVSNLLDLLGVGGGQRNSQGNNGGSGGNGGSDSGDQSDGRSDLTNTIGQLTNEFVSNLLQLLGIGGGQQGGQPGNTGGSGGGSTGSGSTGQHSLGDQIGQLTNSFVSNLLNLLGVGGQGGQNGQFAGTGCQGQVECAPADGSPRTRQPAPLSSRAPPLLGDDDTSNTDSPYRLASWSGGLGSSSNVSQALDDRLAVINGQKSLTAAKTQLAQKKITKAAYNKQVAAQKARQTKANQSMGQLDPQDAQLINDTITGQQNLATAKSRLDAARKRLDAGKITKAAYDKQAAAYHTQADKVDAQTARLRDAAGYDSATTADPGRDGAGAACSTSGAFGECSTAAVDPKTGQLTRDQSLCMPGISECSSSVAAGNRAAVARCAQHGCVTSAKLGANESGYATCGAGECNLASTADSSGADSWCQARNGCHHSTSFPVRPNTADATTKTVGTTSGKSQAFGACTHNCALTGHASPTGASLDCNTGTGHCNGDAISNAALSAPGQAGKPGSRTTHGRSDCSAIAG